LENLFENRPKDLNPVLPTNSNRVINKIDPIYALVFEASAEISASIIGKWVSGKG
jgi:hypothetical protein